MEIDQDLAFGWDPPGGNHRELHQELSDNTSGRSQLAEEPSGQTRVR
jgi:hypothetical protein